LFTDIFMNEIIVNFVLVIAGIFMLLKGADYLISLAIYVADRTGVPKFIVGVTLIAFGTSIPELAVTLLSSFQGKNELAIASILGSNISNILLIIGLGAFLYPLRITRAVATRDIPFSLISIIIFSVVVFDKVFTDATTNMLLRSDGLILLISFAIFIYYVAFTHKKHFEDNRQGKKKVNLMPKAAKGLFGLLLLILGGTLVVESAVLLAKYAGVTERVIGLTVVAIGTSLPELVTMLIALKRGEAELGLGNIVGSNIFNLLFVLGISVSLSPVTDVGRIEFDFVVLLLATILLIASLYLGKRNKVDKLEGGLFLILFIVYLLLLVFVPQI